MQVQKLLGKGSYGIVYRVKRLSDGGVYALKEADVRKMSPLERADAVNEIRLLASVKHPNVVRYHEAFLDGMPMHCCMKLTDPKLPGKQMLMRLDCNLQAICCALSWSMHQMETWEDLSKRGMS